MKIDLSLDFEWVGEDQLPGCWSSHQILHLHIGSETEGESQSDDEIECRDAEMIFVPVLDHNRKKLMPTTPSRARRWVRDHEATGY